MNLQSYRAPADRPGQGLRAGRLALLLASAAALAPSLVWAADVADEADTTTSVEEVIVTAERRAESLQRVPVAVSAVTANEVEKAGVVTVQQLQSLSPGLVLTQQINASTPYLRGVGATQGGAGTEATVSTYIDGVYIGPTLGGIFSFNNIERIEVLRGPQGTLFGRNATGGLIQVHTRTPSSDRQFKIGATAQNYQLYTGTLYAAGGLTDTLAADVALYAKTQGKGYGRNLTLNQEVNYGEEVAARTKWVYRPTDDLTVTLAADYDWRNDDSGMWRNIFPGTVGLGGTRPAPRARDVQSDVPRRTFQTQGGASLKVEYDLGWATLTSLSAFREYLTKIDYDQDNTPLRVVLATFHHSDSTYQQEFLLQGDTERLKWTAGLFYYGDATDHKLSIRSAVAPASNFIQIGYLTTDSYAIFGQGTYNLTDTTRLTLGVRYTRDEQQFAGNRYALPGNPRPAGTVLVSLAGAKDSVEKVTYRVALDHQFSERVMGYASYSRGFKTGGFNINDLTQAPIKPEILDSIEAGLKSELFDRRLRLNLSAFHYDYKDIQAQSSTAGITLTLNASRGKLYGGEAEVEFVPSVPVGDLRFRGTLAYLHARYKSFPGSPIFVPVPGVCTPAPASTGPATGGNLTCVGDVSGNTMVRSPEITATVSANYRLPVGEGTLDLGADIYHSDSFFWAPDNRLTQPSYTLLNGQVAYEFGNGLRVRAFGRNLTNKLYYYWVFSSSLGDGAYPAEPRTYGIGIDYKF